MAIIAYYTVDDDKGDKSTIEIPIPSATTLSDVPLFVSAMGDLIEAIVQGGITAAGARIEVDTSGWTDVASSVADVQEKALFVFRTALNNIKKVHLPTFPDLLFNAGSDSVDLTDTDVAAFVTAMEDGIDLTGAGGTGIVQPSDYRDEDVDHLEKATEAWGKKRG